MSQLSTLGATCTEQNITEFEQIANRATDLFVDPSDIGVFLQRFTQISGPPKVIAIRNRCLAHFFNRVSNNLKEKIIRDIPILHCSRLQRVNISASDLLLHVGARVHAATQIMRRNNYRIGDRLLADCGIEGHDARIAIAKACATLDPEGTISRIRNFDITNEEVLIEIAKICAQRNAGKTAQLIPLFGIKNQEALVEIAIICARENGYATALAIRGFRITNEGKRLFFTGKAKLTIHPGAENGKP